MKNSVPFVISIFSMACVFRIVCSMIDNMDVVIVMAFINACSLMFVLYFIVSDIENGVIKRVNEFQLLKGEKNRIIKRFKLVVNCCVLIVFSAFGVTYMFFYSELSNDIISIIALGISIISLELGESIENNIIQYIEKNL